MYILETFSPVSECGIFGKNRIFGKNSATLLLKNKPKYTAGCFKNSRLLSRRHLQKIITVQTDDKASERHIH